MAIGGGGLIAGVGAYLKALKPDIQIIGVEPTGVLRWRGRGKGGFAEQSYSWVGGAGPGAACTAVGCMWMFGLPPPGSPLRAPILFCPPPHHPTLLSSH